jgi:anti-sigma factor RsiW
MNCAGALALLEPYIDGELEAWQSAEVRRHVGECAGCAAAHERLAELSSGVRALAPRYEASAELRERVLAGIRREAGAAKPVAASKRRLWLAAAAAVVVGVLAGWNVFLMGRGEGGEEIAQELVAGHVRSMMGDHLLDVPSGDRHNVKPWFNGKLDFSPDVRDLAEQGFPLAGGRLDYVDREPAAALIYRRRQHTINLFVWRGTEAAKMPGGVNGFAIVNWTRDGLNYAAVSDLNQAELRQFAALYR